MTINPQHLKGQWKAGYALDLHTLASIPLEKTTKKVTETVYIDGQPVSIEKEVQEVTKWDTTYTPIGLEMNQLKYHGQVNSAEIIGEAAANFLMQYMPSWNIDLIIPIPPSNLTRKFQPVYEIAYHVSRLCSLPVDFHSLEKVITTSEQKGIDDPAKRKELLKDAFSIEISTITGKNILLFDDLYRSGETLNAACNVITNQGNAKSVYVLTVTKTRSKR